MRNKKVFQMLSTFSKAELSEMGDFVSSPFFNGYDYVIRFWKYIQRFHPGFDSDDFTKEKVFEKLYPDRKYNDELMRHLVSQLKKVTDKYLVCKNILNNKFESDFILMNEYHKRKLSQIQELKMREIESYLNKQDGISHNFFEQKMRYEIIRGDFILQSGLQYNIPEEFVKRSEYIAYFILLNLVKMGLDEKYIREELKEVTYSTVVKELLGQVNFKNFTSAIEKNSLESNSPLSKILEIKYYEMECILDKDNDEIFRKYYSLMKNNLHLFDKTEKYNLFTTLLNSTFVKINSGKKEFQGELFSIYKWMLELNLYSSDEEGYFNPVLFRNIFIDALKQGELDWAENFLDEYGQYLNYSNRDDLLKHYSRLYFQRKEFDKAIEYSGKIKTEDVLDRIDVNNILLMCYFEKGNLDDCYTILDKYKHYLTKKRLSNENFSDVYANFIKIFIKLLKLKENPSVSAKHEAEKEMGKYNVFAFKSWLVEKISEVSI